ncbi:prepilin-type N-terminal cleavage/methylation domain-containing protein [Fictibacillus nanhaiensis]|uniref:prepilin-type N-terminal cleavage/methylation domain-containing protein n=1 Tax=Fictibacillus nanhaiensis TaxID=742169 RepID=UPI001C941380|nr:prepilin-type N-terminal cleavage/methylation domain-containing protein [Fictibacillus nanhaiensis]MBY6037052.1 prepilin-type N-terminal cleavage/methylation domain-containing protein [Fictibacillus nanhaiensis]
MRIKLLNEKGFTLIESLLSLVLFSIIGTVVYFVLLSGLHTEKKIYTETLIRDEADLVMSQIIDVLYTAPATKVKDAAPGNGSLLIYQKDAANNTTVGFVGQEPIINGQSIGSSGFDFTNSSIQKIGNSVKIILNVKSKTNQKAKPLSLQSQFGLLEE